MTTILQLCFVVNKKCSARNSFGSPFLKKKLKKKIKINNVMRCQGLEPRMKNFQCFYKALLLPIGQQRFKFYIIFFLVGLEVIPQV